MKEKLLLILHSRKRFVLYAVLLALVIVVTFFSVWAVRLAGTYLTREGDWQDLAGEYRIGVIDYTVDINGEDLIVQATGQSTVTTYSMVVPQIAGVRIFDETISDVSLLEKEFNEGVTLMRIRIVNRSDNLVSVGAEIELAEQVSAKPIMLLPLPVELDRDMAESLNYRQFVLDTLGVADSTTGKAESEALKILENAYAQRPASVELPVGIIPGSSLNMPDGGWIQEGNRYYSYKDVFLLVWSEYGDGEYNSATLSSGAQPDARWGRFHAMFTVGQLD